MRTAVPLTDMLAAQHQAARRPYGRAVFCMAYADTEVLRRNPMLTQHVHVSGVTVS